MLKVISAGSKRNEAGFNEYVEYSSRQKRKTEEHDSEDDENDDANHLLMEDEADVCDKLSVRPGGRPDGR